MLKNNAARQKSWWLELATSAAMLVPGCGTGTLQIQTDTSRFQKLAVNYQETV